jgi:hypothetical protein
VNIIYFVFVDDHFSSIRELNCAWLRIIHLSKNVLRYLKTKAISMGAQEMRKRWINGNAHISRLAYRIAYYCFVLIGWLQGLPEENERSMIKNILKLPFSPLLECKATNFATLHFVMYNRSNMKQKHFILHSSHRTHLDHVCLKNSFLSPLNFLSRGWTNEFFIFNLQFFHHHHHSLCCLLSSFSFVRSFFIVL